MKEELDKYMRMKKKKKIHSRESICLQQEGHKMKKYSADEELEIQWVCHQSITNMLKLHCICYYYYHKWDQIISQHWNHSWQELKRNDCQGQGYMII